MAGVGTVLEVDRLAVLCVVRREGIGRSHVGGILDAVGLLNLGNLLNDVVPEVLEVDQDLVVNMDEWLVQSAKIATLQLLLVQQSDDIVQLYHCDHAVLIFVDLATNPDEFL